MGVGGCFLHPSSTKDDLAQAVASQDRGTILRGFHRAIWDNNAEMDEALPAIRKYLTHSDPWVRYLAAEALYTAGDESGFAALTGLVRSPQPIPQRLSQDDNGDLREGAAHLLVKFRQRKAATELFVPLYRQTRDRKYLSHIIKLLGKETPPDIKADLPPLSQARLGDATFQEAAEKEFREPFAPDIWKAERRQEAAWILARLTGEDSYVLFLEQAAQPAIDGRQRANGYNENTKALRYLGSLQHPRARSALERALDSPNTFAVDLAVVNLLFNQPGRSEKAEQLIMRQMQVLPLRLSSWESAFWIAAKIDTPEMRATGESCVESGAPLWRRWGVKRKNWPIYWWIGIDDYVVEWIDR
jgi:HEAT repeat protein